MSDLSPCGTRAAYRRHLRRHETACAACRAAHAAEVGRYRRPTTGARPGPKSAWRREQVLEEWAELRDVVSFEAFAAKVGMTYAAWERAYQRARAAGDPRAVGRPGRVTA